MLHDPIKVHVVSGLNILEYKGNTEWINNGNATLTSKEEAEVFLFLGGSDINPLLYNQKSKKNCGFINEERDDYEVKMYNYGLKNKKIMFGICRGLQLITALNGGRLIQHVGHHSGNHSITIVATQEQMITNSIHHQMCFPYDLPKEDYQVLAFSTKNDFKEVAPTLFTYRTNEQEEEIYDHKRKGKRFIKYITDFAEPEMIIYPKTFSLGVQGHPEMFGKNALFQDYLKYINSVLLEIVKKVRYRKNLESMDDYNEFTLKKLKKEQNLSDLPFYH